MKTNHTRSFKAKNHSKHPNSFGGCDSGLSPKNHPMGISIGAGIGHGSKRQEQHMKKGAKKFVHSRTRFRENAILQKTIKEEL